MDDIMCRKRVSVDGSCYFLTTVTHARKPFFQDENSTLMLIDVIRNGCNIRRAVLYTYAVMPDHYHILVKLNEKESVSRLLHSINSFSGNKFGDKGESVWQRSPWDEVIRNTYMFYQKMAYILLNPYRKNLVKNPMDDSFRTNLALIMRNEGSEFLQELFEKYTATEE